MEFMHSKEIFLNLRVEFFKGDQNKSIVNGQSAALVN